MAEDFPDRAAIRSRQLAQLRALLAAVIPANAFYTRKFSGAAIGPAIGSLGEFSARAPFTTKPEIVTDQAEHPPYGTDLTFSRDRYTRFHQTSGTTGAPLRWLDTPESWNALLDCWEQVFRAAGVTASDHVLFAFSFGPFLGFWMAFESAQRIGCLCLPAGGMSSVARIRMVLDNGATVLCCTPTYAARLAEVAAEEKIDLRPARVKTIIVAGEPGGSIPAIRESLSRQWNGARVFDHHGMTEVGPVTHECPRRPGRLHVIESGYYAEVLEAGGDRPVAEGQTGELVLTTLRRTGSPLLRYRTGDLVRPVHRPDGAGHPPCECGRHELALDGGILGRCDDMIIVRGVNIYPSAVEEIIRSTADVGEFQVTVTGRNSLAELGVRVEPRSADAPPAALAKRLEKALYDALGLRVPVVPVPAGSLPRFEMKAKRWVKL
jgi:phenylacetate-CoA ligase